MQGISSWLLAHTDRWHDTWEIVGALATSAAVLFSLITTLVQSRARARAEEERDVAISRERSIEDELRRERREAQARGIAIWITEGGHDPQTGDSTDDLITIYVKNYTQMPVFNVRGSMFVAGSPVTVKTEDVLLPGVTLLCYVRPSDAPDAWGGAQGCVQFRDTAGLEWLRFRSGLLQERPTSSATTLR
jgi:hypothetical protein